MKTSALGGALIILATLLVPVGAGLAIAAGSGGAGVPGAMAASYLK